MCERALATAFRECGGVPRFSDEQAVACLRSKGVAVDGACANPCRVAGDSRAFCVAHVDGAGVVYGTPMHGGPSRLVGAQATSEKEERKRTSWFGS